MTSSNEDEFTDAHIFRMTDDTGIFQHCKYGVPDPGHGYTTDDNARALIMAGMLYKKYGKEKYLGLVYRYMSFVLNSQNGEGKFKNFMTYNRNFIEREGSEDCFGRCLWALGATMANSGTPENIKNTCAYILENAVVNIPSLDSPRAKAYSIIGLGYARKEDTIHYIDELANSLVSMYKNHSDKNWQWFENIIAYCNAVLPWALLVSYSVLKDKELLDVALKAMRFLEKVTFKNDFYKPVGCNGWFVKGKEPAEFDEQPVEACETTLAYLEAYKITGEGKYLERAKQSYNWYNSQNSKNISMIDSETGGCFDGITEQRVNLNQGSESLVSYFIARLAMTEAPF